MFGNRNWTKLPLNDAWQQLWQHDVEARTMTETNESKAKAFALSKRKLLVFLQKMKPKPACQRHQFREYDVRLQLAASGKTSIRHPSHPYVMWWVRFLRLLQSSVDLKPINRWLNKIVVNRVLCFHEESVGIHLLCYWSRRITHAKLWRLCAVIAVDCSPIGILGIGALSQIHRNHSINQLNSRSFINLQISFTSNTSH